MSKDKKSFILYLDQQDLFNKLPDEMAGKLIKHIFSYVNCENPEANDLLLDVAFSLIKQSLKRDLNKWESQLKQRSEAGKKSAEKRANDKQRKATSVESRSTNPTDSVNVNVNVNVSDSDSVSDSKAIKKTSRFTPPSLEDVHQYCNERMNHVDPSSFVDHDIGNGWVRGKTKIKDWKACVRTWEKNAKPKSQNVKQYSDITEQNINTIGDWLND